MLFSQTSRPSLAAFDDQGYPFFLIVLSANYMKLGPGCGYRVQGTSRTAFVGDPNDRWRPKGFRHDQARPIGARDPIAAFPLSAKARGTEERPQGPLSDRGSETVRRRAIPSSKANMNLTNYQHAPGGDGRIAVPSSRESSHAAMSLAGDGTIQRRLVLICKNPHMARSRAALGEAAFRSIETSGERSRQSKHLVRCPSPGRV
jgi:hypothetical protein